MAAEKSAVLKELWYLRRLPGSPTVAKLKECPNLIRPYWARADLALDPLTEMLKDYATSSEEKVRMAARVLLDDSSGAEKKYEAIASQEHCDPRTVKRQSDDGLTVIADIVETSHSLITSVTGMVGLWLEGEALVIELGYRLRPPFKAKAPRVSFEDSEESHELEYEVVEIPGSVMVTARLELDLKSVRHNEIAVVPPYHAPCAFHVRSNVDPERLEVAFYVTEGTCHITLLNREVSMNQMVEEFAASVPEEYRKMLPDDFFEFDWSADGEDVRPSLPRIASFD